MIAGLMISMQPVPKSKGPNCSSQPRHKIPGIYLQHLAARTSIPLSKCTIMHQVSSSTGVNIHHAMIASIPQDMKSIPAKFNDAHSDLADPPMLAALTWQQGTEQLTSSQGSTKKVD